jgi:hypothetical protein
MKKSVVIVGCVIVLTLASGCGSSTGSAATSTSPPSTAPAKLANCSSAGAVVVNLPQLGAMSSTATVKVGQEIWVVYKSPTSSSTGPLSGGLSYPATWGPSSPAVHAVCDAATDQTIGTLFRATASGHVEISADNKCSSGCARMASIAVVTVEAD